MHGNNKDEALLRAGGGRSGAPVVLDAPDEAERAAAAGVERVLVRVTLGVDADTHEAIGTGHHGSKFGLPPDQARAVVAEALERGLDVLGAPRPRRLAARRLRRAGRDDRRLASFAAGCRDELGWTPRVADLGGGFGIRHHPDDEVPDAAELARQRCVDGRASRSSRRACRSPRSGSSRDAASSAGQA